MPSFDTTPFFTTTPSNQACLNYYTLFAGDTCDRYFNDTNLTLKNVLILILKKNLSIALAYRSTIQDLLNLNSNLNCQYLAIGQQICVPPLDQNTFPTNPVNPTLPVNPTCSNYYTIFNGDSCERLTN